MIYKKRLQQIFKVNLSKLLLSNFKKISLTIKFLKNGGEIFWISVNRNYILKKYRIIYIREHHHLLKFKYLKITNTIDIIKRSCHFDNVKKHIWNYIMKCTSC